MIGLRKNMWANSGQWDMNGGLLGSVREKFSQEEREKDSFFCCFWTLSSLDVPAPPPTDVVVLLEAKTNKWLRKQPRGEETNRRKSSALKNYWNWNSILLTLLVTLGNLSQFSATCNQRHHHWFQHQASHGTVHLFSTKNNLYSFLSWNFLYK